jgi:hypothetical protein
MVVPKNGTKCNCAYEFLITPQSPTTQRKCGPECESDQYSQPPPPEELQLEGICLPIRNCSTKFAAYQSHAPTKTSNRQCIATCGSADYFGPAEPPRTSSGICTPIQNCSTLPNLYEIVAPTKSTDRACAHACQSVPIQFRAPAFPANTSLGICTNTTFCSNPFFSLQSAPPSETTDRLCTAYCSADHFSNPPLPIGTSSGVCTPTKSCIGSQGFEILPPTNTTDRVCGPACPHNMYAHLIANNPAAYFVGVCTPVSNCTSASPFERTPSTSTTDRQCVQQCQIDEYAQRPAPSMVGTAVGICTTKTTCTPPTVQSRAPTATTDRACSIRGSSRISNGAEIGSIIGGLALFALVVAGLVLFWRRSHTMKVEMAVMTVALDTLVSQDSEREARVQRLLLAWQIPESHLTFVRRLTESELLCSALGWVGMVHDRTMM